MVKICSFGFQNNTVLKIRTNARLMLADEALDCSADSNCCSHAYCTSTLMAFISQHCRTPAELLGLLEDNILDISLNLD